nr:MAG TPA: hypothetical protein [Caudoviricetes sp.]
MCSPSLCAALLALLVLPQPLPLTIDPCGWARSSALGADHNDIHRNLLKGYNSARQLYQRTQSNTSKIRHDNTKGVLSWQTTSIERSDNQRVSSLHTSRSPLWSGLS